MSGSHFIMGTRWNLSRLGSLVTLTQGHRDGCKKIDTTIFGFPGKLKSVSRTEAAAETDQEQKVPRLPYPEWLNKDFILKHQTCRTDVIWNLLLRYYIWAILINIFTLVKDIVPRWACQSDNPIGITFWFIVWKFMADAVHSLMLFLYMPNVFLL